MSASDVYKTGITDQLHGDDKGRKPTGIVGLYCWDADGNTYALTSSDVIGKGAEAYIIVERDIERFACIEVKKPSDSGSVKTYRYQRLGKCIARIQEDQPTVNISIIKVDEDMVRRLKRYISRGNCNWTLAEPTTDAQVHVGDDVIMVECESKDRRGTVQHVAYNSKDGDSDIFTIKPCDPREPINDCVRWRGAPVISTPSSDDVCLLYGMISKRDEENNAYAFCMRRGMDKVRETLKVEKLTLCLPPDQEMKTPILPDNTSSASPTGATATFDAIDGCLPAVEPDRARSDTEDDDTESESD